MRFGEHFCAADFYKSGNCRGICVEIVLDFGFGAVGFLINGAQRAGAGSNRTTESTERDLELNWEVGILGSR
jgi:hypothetical protein